MMAEINQIGKVTEVSGKFEWEIHGFFYYTQVDAQYQSPAFFVSDSILCFKITPLHLLEGSQYVSLYLRRVSSNAPETFEFEFGIKTDTQEIINITKTARLNDEIDWGFKKFVKRHKLEKSPRVAPLGVLTIVCFIKVYNNVTSIHAKRKLTEDYKDLFFSKRNTDVTLNVKKRKITAHKVILESRSPVFAAMFQSDMSEKKTGVVNIPDCDPQTFDMFLLYLYSGTVDFEKCNACQLYRIADKYTVPELKSVCIDFMTGNLTIENFVEALMLGHQFDEQDFLTKIQSYFNENFEKIVASSSWKDLFKRNFNLANDLLKNMAPKVVLMK